MDNTVCCCSVSVYISNVMLFNTQHVHFPSLSESYVLSLQKQTKRSLLVNQSVLDHWAFFRLYAAILAAVVKPTTVYTVAVVYFSIQKVCPQDVALVLLPSKYNPLQNDSRLFNSMFHNMIWQADIIFWNWEPFSQ